MARLPSVFLVFGNFDDRERNDRYFQDLVFGIDLSAHHIEGNMKRGKKILSQGMPKINQ